MPCTYPFPRAAPFYGEQGHLGPLRSAILVDGPPTGGTSSGTLALTVPGCKEFLSNRVGAYELGCRHPLEVPNAHLFDEVPADRLRVAMCQTWALTPVWSTSLLYEAGVGFHQ